MNRPRTSIYVDGFNLFYGACKRSGQKWLNLKSLFERLLPKHDIKAIHYFTARVKPTLRNPKCSANQQIYLRALATIPEMHISFGHFLRHTVRMPLADGSGVVEVIKTEEKGSDVNLASQLIVDGFRQQFERAAVCSNDSDLAEPVRVVTKELGIPVGVINPHPKQSQKLKGLASFLKQIRLGDLKACQFPDEMTDQRGSFQKPEEWR
ncbi:MAG: hypothetical protein ACI8UO_001588 [Verrucomicrobiales bacterium]|jgi:hypothetical protein